MMSERPDDPIPIDLRLNRRVQQLQAAGLFTVKDVAGACGLPQPVVAQLVRHIPTDCGWMYTADQLAYAKRIAPDVRAGRYVAPRESV
jgi:hypothetical protein